MFIWISFLDGYFEILLYVGPHSLPLRQPLGAGLVWWPAPGWRGEDRSQGAPGAQTKAQAGAPCVHDSYVH